MLEQEINNRAAVSKGWSWKQWTALSLRFLVSVGACVFLITYIDWNEFTSYVTQSNLGYIAAAFFAVHLCIWISGFKWYVLCRPKEDVSFWQCLRWYYIGFFFNNFLPGSLGGDGARMYYAGKKMGAAHSIASVVTERVFAGIALSIVMSVGLLSTNRGGGFWFEITIVFALCIMAYNLLFNYRFSLLMRKRFGRKAASFYDAIHSFKSFRLFLELLSFSLAFQVCFVWVTDLLYRSMGITLPFLTQLGFVSLISALTMVPVSINGLGIREGTYAYLFMLIGVEQSVSVAVSLLFFVLVLAATSIGGLIYLLERGDNGSAQKNSS